MNTKGSNLRFKGFILCLILCIFTVCNVSDKFSFFRNLGVTVLYHLAVVFNVGDMSRGQLFTDNQAITSLLPHEPGGCIWEVGAHDGVWESNSYYLIHHRMFKAWLFEPSPEAFVKLKNLYGERTTDILPSRIRGGARRRRGYNTVQLFNIALSNESHMASYQEFPTGLENTLTAYDRHNQFERTAGYRYTVAAQHAKVLCEQQTEALLSGDCKVGSGDGERSHIRGNTSSGASSFTVLSIDAEGADTSVLEAAHSTGCTWDLLIVESLYMTPSDMKSLGYQYIKKVGYNHVFAPIKSKQPLGGKMDMTAYSATFRKVLNGILQSENRSTTQV